MAWYQHAFKLTVPGSGTATYTLPQVHTPLDRMTIWVSSGRRHLADLSAQPQVNGKNLGSSTSWSAVAAADVVYSSGGATADNQLIPFQKVVSVPPAGSVGVDEFTFSVLFTNSDVAAVSVTVYVVGISL